MGKLADFIQCQSERLLPWAQTNDVECYRLYQEDLPEFPFIVDRYADYAVVWLNERELSEKRNSLEEFIHVITEELRYSLGISNSKIIIKRRHPGGQYNSQREKPLWLNIREHGLKFKANLTTYHDTGLFLDHRPTRRYIRQSVRNKRVLNLFCYTGSFTVYAAAGQAHSTTSVDLSASYLDWLEDNLAINDQLKGEHYLVRADVQEWLKNAYRSGRRFDIIICDPPTFSNSKSATNFDVHRHHPELIENCLKLLAPGGWLLFSCNKRNFTLDEKLQERHFCRNVTSLTTDPDFAGRNHHYAWIIK